MSEIEQRARELLAAEMDRSGRKGTANKIRQGRPAMFREELRAIVAALTPPEGFVLVPVKPTKAMVNASADAYMPFGDMEAAIQAAISARPEVA